MSFPYSDSQAEVYSSVDNVDDAVTHPLLFSMFQLFLSCRLPRSSSISACLPPLGSQRCGPWDSEHRHASGEARADGSGAAAAGPPRDGPVHLSAVLGECQALQKSRLREDMIRHNSPGSIGSSSWVYIWMKSDGALLHLSFNESFRSTTPDYELKVPEVFRYSPKVL